MYDYNFVGVVVYGLQKHTHTHTHAERNRNDMGVDLNCSGVFAASIIMPRIESHMHSAHTHIHTERAREKHITHYSKAHCMFLLDEMNEC